MPSLLIVDDDELSREVLDLLATEAGFDCSVAESGPEALEMVAAGLRPEVVLCDMQMPGVSGDSLARLMRAACGQGTMLLAMSGSEVPADAVASFDGFLLKPFAMEELLAAAAGGGGKTPAPAGELNHTTYTHLAASMPAAQVKALYALCVEDAERRLAGMRTAAAARDSDTYVRAAHAIKGSCGMVGATELAGLAGAMETGGLPEVGNEAPFAEFLAACGRLRRMLDALSE